MKIVKKSLLLTLFTTLVLVLVSTFSVLAVGNTQANTKASILKVAKNKARDVKLKSKFTQKSSKVKFKLVNNVKKSPLVITVCKLAIEGNKGYIKAKSSYSKKNNIITVHTNLAKDQKIKVLILECLFKHPNKEIKGRIKETYRFTPKKVD